MLVLRKCTMQQVVHLNAILMKNEKHLCLVKPELVLNLIVIHITLKKLT